MNLTETLAMQEPINIQCHIEKRDGGWVVVSQDRKKTLSKPYKSRAEAVKRLQQIEYFKHAS